MMEIEEDYIKRLSQKDKDIQAWQNEIHSSER